VEPKSRMLEYEKPHQYFHLIRPLFYYAGFSFQVRMMPIGNSGLSFQGIMALMSFSRSN
jgi:hypothetical protein